MLYELYVENPKHSVDAVGLHYVEWHLFLHSVMVFNWFYVQKAALYMMWLLKQQLRQITFRYDEWKQIR